MDRFRRLFSSLSNTARLQGLTLRWKLVLSYVGVTTATLLALEVCVLLTLAVFGGPIRRFWVVQSSRMTAEYLVELAREPLEHGDLAGLEEALRRPAGVLLQFSVAVEPESGDPSETPSDERIVIDNSNHVLASDLPERYPPGSALPLEEFMQGDDAWAGAPVCNQPAEGEDSKHGSYTVVRPIVGSGGACLGRLVYRLPGIVLTGFSTEDIAVLLAASLALLPCMIPLGLVFGFATSIGFTRRLRALERASLALARGDLTQRVADESGDEIGRLSRQFNRMAEQIEADTIRLRKMAAMEERHRLARDLHDGIKQNLFGMNLATSAAANLLDTDLEAARGKLREAKEHSRLAAGEMQTLLQQIRPSDLESRGFPETMQEYLAAFGKREGLEISWESGGGIRLIDAEERVLFRVIQEALTNAARHARASRIRVSWSALPEGIRLCIADDGIGFTPSNPESSGSMGLRGIRERLEEIGGELSIESVPGAGTRLVIRLPGGKRGEKGEMS